MAKQQTYDATKMGPLSWRQLQLANQNYYANLEPGDDLRTIMEANTVKAIPNSGSPELNWEGRVQSPIMRNSNGRDYWGKSMWDEQVADANDFYNNLSDIRGQNQPWYAQLGAGVLKGVTTAATTFLDGTIGLLYGAGSAMANLDASKVFNNDVSNAFQDFNEFMEEFAPNYKSRDEENNKWYQNLGTMNFWADGLIKNIGFTVGAFYSGGAFTKTLKGIGWAWDMAKAGKAVKEAKLSSEFAKNTMKAMEFEALQGARSGTGVAVAGSVLSAVNEGRIEANQVYRDAFTLGNSPEESKGAAREILMAERQRMQEIEEDITLTANEKAILQQQVRDKSNALLKQAEEKAASAGMLTLALNIPILSIDNFKMFGRLYSRGFKQSVKQVGNNVILQELKAAQDAVKNATTKAEKEAAKKALREVELKAKTKHNITNRNEIEDVAEGITEKDGRVAWNDITTKQAVWKGFKTGLMEGNEEMAQAFVSSTAGNMTMPEDPNAYYKALTDPNATVKTNDFLTSVTKGFLDSYGNGDRWEEGAIGFITGILGMPTFGTRANSDSNTWLGRGKMIGLSGGLGGEISNANYLNRLGNEAANNINAFRDKYKHHAQFLSQSQAFTNAMDGYLKDKNEFAYNNARDNDDFAMISAFAVTGRLDEIRNAINIDVNNLNQEDLRSIATSFTPNSNLTDSEGTPVSTDNEGMPLQGAWRDKNGKLMSETEEGQKEMKKLLQEKKENLIQEIDDYVASLDSVRMRTNNSLDESQIRELAWLDWKGRQWTNRFKQLKQGDLVKSLDTLINKASDLMKNEEAESAEFKALNNFKDLLEEVKKTESPEQLIGALTKNNAFFAALSQSMGVGHIVDKDKTFVGDITIGDILAKDSLSSEALNEIGQALNDIRMMATAKQQFKEKLDEYVNNPSKLVENRAKIDEEKKKEEEVTNTMNQSAETNAKTMLNYMNMSNSEFKSQDTSLMNEEQKKKYQEADDTRSMADRLKASVANDPEATEEAKNDAMQLIIKAATVSPSYDNFTDSSSEVYNDPENIQLSEEDMDGLKRMAAKAAAQVTPEDIANFKTIRVGQAQRLIAKHLDKVKNIPNVKDTEVKQNDVPTTGNSQVATVSETENERAERKEKERKKKEEENKERAELASYIRANLCKVNGNYIIEEGRFDTYIGSLIPMIIEPGCVKDKLLQGVSIDTIKEGVVNSTYYRTAEGCVKDGFKDWFKDPLVPSLLRKAKDMYGSTSSKEEKKPTEEDKKREDQLHKYVYDPERDFHKRIVSYLGKRNSDIEETKNMFFAMASSMVGKVKDKKDDESIIKEAYNSLACRNIIDNNFSGSTKKTLNETQKEHLKDVMLPELLRKVKSLYDPETIARLRENRNNREIIDKEENPVTVVVTAAQIGNTDVNILRYNEEKAEREQYWKSTTTEYGQGEKGYEKGNYKRFYERAESLGYSKELQKRIEAISKYFLEHRVWDRVNTGDNGLLEPSKGTIRFKIDPKLNEAAGETVILMIDKQGNVIGDMPSKNYAKDKTKEFIEWAENEYENYKKDNPNSGEYVLQLNGKDVTTHISNWYIGKVPYSKREEGMVSLNRANDNNKFLLGVAVRNSEGNIEVKTSNYKACKRSPSDKKVRQPLPTSMEAGQPFMLVKSEGRGEYMCVPFITPIINKDNVAAIKESKYGEFLIGELKNIRTVLKNASITDRNKEFIIKDLLNDLFVAERGFYVVCNKATPLHIEINGQQFYEITNIDDFKEETLLDNISVQHGEGVPIQISRKNINKGKYNEALGSIAMVNIKPLSTLKDEKYSDSKNDNTALHTIDDWFAINPLRVSTDNGITNITEVQAEGPKSIGVNYNAAPKNIKSVQVDDTNITVDLDKKTVKIGKSFTYKIKSPIKGKDEATNKLIKTAQIAYATAFCEERGLTGIVETEIGKFNADTKTFVGSSNGTTSSGRIPSTTKTDDNAKALLGVIGVPVAGTTTNTTNTANTATTNEQPGSGAAAMASLTKNFAAGITIQATPTATTQTTAQQTSEQQASNTALSFLNNINPNNPNDFVEGLNRIDPNGEVIPMEYEDRTISFTSIEHLMQYIRASYANYYETNADSIISDAEYKQMMESVLQAKSLEEAEKIVNTVKYSKEALERWKEYEPKYRDFLTSYMEREKNTQQANEQQSTTSQANEQAPSTEAQPVQQEEQIMEDFDDSAVAPWDEPEWETLEEGLAIGLSLDDILKQNKEFADFYNRDEKFKEAVDYRVSQEQAQTSQQETPTKPTVDEVLDKAEENSSPTEKLKQKQGKLGRKIIDFDNSKDTIIWEEVLKDYQEELANENLDPNKTLSIIEAVKSEYNYNSKRGLKKKNPNFDLKALMEKRLKYRRADNQETATWNKEEELNWLKKNLPQFSEKDRLKIVDGLIKIASKDNPGYAYGQYVNALITIGSQAASGTLYHEAFHAIVDTLLSEKEYNDLFDAAYQVYGNLGMLGLEEKLAEEFRKFVQYGDNVAFVDYDADDIKTPIIRGIVRLFRRLKALIQGLSNKQIYLNKLFYDINKGKFADRKVQEGRNLQPKFDINERELEDIKKKAIADGIFMKAPNGKPTNLNERQWLQVRTKAFKEWFGDWENNPSEASKVVDENGEPLAVYHGTLAEFTVFDFEKLGEVTGLGYYIDKQTGEKIPVDSASAFFFTNQFLAADSYKNLSIQQQNDLRADFYQNMGVIFRSGRNGAGSVIRFEGDNFKEQQNFLDNVLSPVVGFDVRREANKILHNESTMSKEEREKWGTKFFNMRDKIRNSADARSISNTRQFIRSAENELEFLIKNKNNILSNNKLTELDGRSIHVSSGMGNTEDGDVYLSVMWEDGKYKVVGLPNTKGMVNITYSNYDAVINEFKRGINNLKNDLNTDIKTGHYDKGNVMQTFLNIKNPLEHNYEGSAFPDKYKGGKHETGYVAARQVKKAKESGNDGVIYRNIRDPFVMDSYGIFNSNQVKSATDNVGTFSRENDDIRYREAEMSIKQYHIQKLMYNNLSYEDKEYIKEKGLSEEDYDKFSMLEKENFWYCR